MPTKIEWAEESWNPIIGCTPISEGCEHCYARRMAQRLRGRCGYPKDDPFRVTFHPDRLYQPLRWKKPRMIFVCSMGDLFHPDVSEYDILAIWQRMGEFHDRNGDILPVKKRPGHTYMVLTKRPERALEFLSHRYPHGYERKNVWLGVSVENQKRADERIPILLQIPAAKRGVSIEPMLGPINLDEWLYQQTTVCWGPGEDDWGYDIEPRDDGIDWIICGGESGPGARPMHPDWPRSIRDQCQAAGVPFFFKQWGGINKKSTGHILDGREWNEIPEVDYAIP